MSEEPSKTDPAPVLEAIDVSKKFALRTGVRSRRTRGSIVNAVEAVSLALVPGEIVAVVGESGSGKTTLGRIMTRLESPTSGRLLLRGKPVAVRGTRTLRAFRRDVQMVFQDPFASLNAGHTISYHLERPLLIHGLADNRADARQRAAALLKTVHLNPAEQYLDKFPTQLSGGQRQRVAIARALSVDPAVIIADEPVSMLDVSIRLSVLNLFLEAARAGLAIVYITHDIASARYFADRAMVMYGGRVVETGPAEEVTTNPQHPYTRLLVDSAPDPNRRASREHLPARAGDTFSAPRAGCSFHTRCPSAMAICSKERPDMFRNGQEHHAACWLGAPDGLPSDDHARAAGPESVPITNSQQR